MNPRGRPRGSARRRISPDGTLVAVPRQDAGCGPPQLSLQHAASRRCLASLPIDGEIGAVYCRFLARGGLLATSWIDRERSFRARLWSLEDPSRPRLRRRLERICAIESSPDGAVFVVADEAGPVTIRDSGTGDPLRVLPLEERERRAIACSSEFGLGGEGVARSVQAWNWRTGASAVARTLPDPIERLIPSPDGYGLAAIDVRGRVHLIPSFAGPVRVIQPEDGDRPRYVSLTFSPDGSRLATAAFGNGADWRARPGRGVGNGEREEAGHVPGTARAGREAGVHARRPVSPDRQSLRGSPLEVPLPTRRDATLSRQATRMRPGRSPSRPTAGCSPRGATTPSPIRRSNSGTRPTADCCRPGREGKARPLPWPSRLTPVCSSPATW